MRRLFRVLIVTVTLVARMSPLALLGTSLTAYAQDDQRCFSQTNFCISGRIRQFYEQNGDVPVFGYPIGPQGPYTSDGGQVVQAQWFERQRIELHPENAAPYDVLIGRVGADLLAQEGINWFTFPQFDPSRGAQADCEDFTQTGHAVCGLFLDYYKSHGLHIDQSQIGITPQESLALLGLPLSEAQQVTLNDGSTYTVQWFERARLELHPENPAPFNVLEGLLGRELTNQITPATTSASQPTATPAPPAATACTIVPASSRSVTVDDVTLTASQFAYHDVIDNTQAGPGYHYLTLNTTLRNLSGLTDTSTPMHRIFAQIDSFYIIGSDGQRYDPDPVTNLLSDHWNIALINALGSHASGSLAFRLPATVTPQRLHYDAKAISDASPQIMLPLRWPGCN